MRSPLLFLLLAGCLIQTGRHRDLRDDLLVEDTDADTDADADADTDTDTDADTDTDTDTDTDADTDTDTDTDTSIDTASTDGPIDTSDTGATTCLPDPREDDDSFDDATDTNGAPQTYTDGTLCADDEPLTNFPADIFYVPLAANDGLRATIGDGTTTSCADQTLSLQVYDDVGNLVTSVGGSNTSSCAALEVPGTSNSRDLFVVVVDFVGEDQDYSLTLDVAASECGNSSTDIGEQCDGGSDCQDCLLVCTDDAKEDDDDQSTPADLDALNPPLEGTLCYADLGNGAQDFFVFEVAQGEYLDGFTVDAGPTTACADQELVVQLYDNTTIELLEEAQTDGTSCAAITESIAGPRTILGRVYGVGFFEPQDYTLVPDIKASVCGDGTVQPNELCEPPNVGSCDSSCLIECTDDAYEDNDDIPSSATITAPFDEVLTLCPQDLNGRARDVFAFSVGDDEYVDRAALLPVGGQDCEDLGVLITVLDATSNAPIAQFDPCSEITDLQIAGDYLIDIVNTEVPLAPTDYQLVLDIGTIECGDAIEDPGEQCDDGDSDDSNGCTTECLLTCVDDQYEDDDSLEQAVDATPLGTWNGITCPQDSNGSQAIDWFTYTIPAGEFVAQVDMSSPGGGDCEVFGAVFSNGVQYTSSVACGPIVGPFPGAETIDIVAFSEGDVFLPSEWEFSVTTEASVCGDSNVDVNEQCEGTTNCVDCLYPCTDDSFEDNDSLTSAVAIPAAGGGSYSQDGTLCASDRVDGAPADFWSISLTSTNSYLDGLSLNAQSGDCSELAAVLRVYDASGAVAFEDTADGNCLSGIDLADLGLNARIEVKALDALPTDPIAYRLSTNVGTSACPNGIPEPGEDCDDGDTDDLDLCLTDCTYGCQDTEEPNNDASGAKSPGPGTIGPYGICTGDEDWFSYDMLAGQTITATVLDGPYHQCGPNGTIDSEISLFDPNIAEVAQNDDYGSVWCSQTSYTAPTAGRYRVRVASSSQFAPDGEFSYTLDVQITGP